MRRASVRFGFSVLVWTLCAFNVLASDVSKPGIALLWHDPNTWVDNTVPTLGEAVTIAPDSGVLINAVTGNVTVSTLTIQGGSVISEDAKLTLSGAITLNVTGDLIMDDSGATTEIEYVDNATLDVDGGIYGTGDINFDEPSQVLGFRPRAHGAVGGGLGGTLLLAGDYSLAGDFDGGEGVVVLDGTAARQQWVNFVRFTDVTITNTFSNPGGGVFDSVKFDAGFDVGGTLRLLGGVISTDSQIHTDNPVFRTSGHIVGYHQQAVSIGVDVRMEVGSFTDYTPVDITPSAGGTISVRANDYRYDAAGPGSLARHWEISASGTGATSVLFHYVSTDVEGDESTYVAGRFDGGTSTWQRYEAPAYTVLRDGTNDQIGASGPAFALDGYWTGGEPASVTTATKLVILTINEGVTPVRRRTPFDLLVQAQDASGNPATVGTFTPIQLSASAGSGVLTDTNNNNAPLNGSLAGGQIEMTFVDLVYSLQESVTLTITDTNATPLTGDSEVVAFGAAATELFVTNADNYGAGSLRHAIQTVNLGGCSGVPCHVGFNLPPELQDVDGTWKIIVPGLVIIDGGGDNVVIGTNRGLTPTTHTGRTLSALPAITSPIDLDGTTQAGYNPLNPQPLVELIGGQPSSPLISLQNTSSKVRALALRGGSQALLLGGGGGHTIEGCYVGLTALGTVPAIGIATQQGIYVDSDNNMIGGMNGDNTASALKRNVISGAENEGVFVNVGTASNTLLGNYIGTNPAGSAALGNGTGILLQGSSQNTIGGAETGARNVVSGNDTWGVLIYSEIEFGESALRNQILGNYIGLAADGIAPLSNSTGGILIGGDGSVGNVIGGMTAPQGNLIGGGNTGIATESSSKTSGFFGNRILAAAVLAIDLDNDGIHDANDTGDPDVNGDGDCTPFCIQTNNGQNRPVIGRAELIGTTLETDVTVDSAAVAATASIRVEVFKAQGNHPAQYLGGVCYNTNFVNNLTIFVTNPGVTAGEAVVTTATSFTSADCELVDGANNLQLSDGTSEASDPMTVTAGTCTPPSVNVTGGSFFCTGGSVTLTANPSGGTAPYSYQWFNGTTPINAANGVSYVVTAGGTYKVVVTDNITCSNESAPFTVTENPNPVVNITGPASTCSGSPVTLDAGAGFTSYSWNTVPVQTTRFITVTPTGNTTYQVTVSNGSCNATDTHSVSVNNPPVVNITGPTSSCAGAPVTLDAGAGFASYSWDTVPPQTTRFITVSPTGNTTYQVTVTDGNTCSASDSHTVTVNNPPVVNITGPGATCAGAPVTLDAGAGFASYSWDTVPPQTTRFITVSPTGNTTYQVNVTDGNTCSANDSHTVTVNSAPVVNITGPTSSCAGAPVTLDAGAGYASYSWNTVPPLTTRFITVSPTGNTTFQVTVGDGNSCTASDSHTVTVNPAPVVNITGPASSCAGAPVTLDAGAGFASYSWDTVPPQTTRFITVSPASTATYQVTVTDGNSCAASDSHTVTVNNPPVVNITGPNATCTGAPVTLDAGAGFSSYSWNTVPPQTTRFITVSPASTTTYEVNVADGNACSGTDTHTVTVSASPTVAITAPPNVCPGSTANASVTPQAGATYAWSITGGTIVGSTTGSSITFKAGGGGSVALSVDVTAGSCTSSGNANVPINTPPSVNITGGSSSCAGAPVTLDAGPGFASYFWDTVPAQTTRVITVSPLATTTYKVVVTDGNSCSAFDTHEVVVSPAPSVSITAPAEMTAHTTAAASIAEQPGATITWTVGNGILLTGQGTKEITFEAGASGSVQLGVAVQIGGCSSTGTANVAIVAQGGADLIVDKSGPASVETGATFNYSITIHNNGPETSSVIVTDTLPAGVTFVGAAVNGWTCSGSNSGVTCNGVLSSGATQTITVTVTAPAQPGTLINHVEAAPQGTIDPDPSNNSDDVQTVVVAPQTCATTPPSLIAPASNATVVSPVAFSWSAVAGAIRYELWITDGGTTTLAGTTASTSLTMPLSSGIKSWHVNAQLPAGCEPLASEPRAFTVSTGSNCNEHGAPQITAPAENSTHTTPVTISWTAVPQAVGYRVWISEDDGALQDIGTTNGATSLLIAAPAGAITVFVDALFGGCPPTRSAGVHFTVPDPDPCAGRGAATPLAPQNNATLDSSHIGFQWSAAPNAGGYRLWAAIGGAAAAVLGETEETSLRVKVDSGEGIWWVETLYPGCASTESARLRFVLPPKGDCGTARPELVAPANNSARTSTQVTFNWQSVDDAVGYEVWLALNNGTFALLATAGPETTSLTHEVPAGALQWFVRVLVNRCPSRDSQARSFTVTLPAACDDNRRPTLSVPADGDEVTSPVDFLFSTIDGATHYEVYVVRGSAAPSLVATTDGDHAGDVNLPTGAARWFVRAFFVDGCPSLDSSEAGFTVVPRPNACATLTPPVIAAPGQISAGSELRIQWTPEPAATQYQLQLASHADFSNASVITTGATAADVIAPAEGTLYARVRAIDTRCTPSPTVSAYGPVTAILVLTAGEAGAADLAHGGALQYSIVLGPEYAGQSFTATSASSFITIAPAAGVVPPAGITLIVSADTSGLPVGSTLAAITISLSGPTLSSNATSVTTTISVNLVTPITPSPKNAPPPDALIIPAVANAAGINAQFQSDVRVSNTSPQPIKYQLTFIPSGEAGISSGRQTSFTVDAGRTVALDDVLKGWFGTGTQNAVGSLEIRPLTKTQTSTSSASVGALANLVSFASSRTFNVTPNGTFGQYIPAVPFANFLGKAANASTKNVLSLQQISQSDKFRTNLGLVEGSGEKADLLIRVFGNNGQQITSFPMTLNGGQHTQLNAFLFQKGITLNDGRVEVEVTSGNGKITAYASVLDNATSDAVLVTPVTLSDTGNTKWVVPGVADVATGFANWKTDMRVFNAGSEEAVLTASFYSQNGGAPKTASLTIAPGEVRQLDKVLPTLFNVTGDGGAVHIESAKSARLIATARTYNETSTGSYGLFASAVTPQEAVGVGSRPLQLLQVEESTRFRSNIGFAEVSGKPVKLEVTIIPPDVKFAAIVEVPLAANEFRQIGSMLASLGLSETYNARISVRAISGEGRATAYAAVIDMKTNDPTYVPAQ